MIKECPFCGGEAKTDNEYWNGRINYWVMCEKCGKASDCYDTPEKALSVWNTRPREEELLDMLKRMEACYLSLGDAEIITWEAGKLIKKYEAENE